MNKTRKAPTDSATKYKVGTKKKVTMETPG